MLKNAAINIVEIAEHLVTPRDFMRFGVSQFECAGIFYGHGTDNAWDECLTLVLTTLSLPMDVGEEVLDARLLPYEREEIARLIKSRAEQNIPLPYLLNKAWFAGLSFFVDERVLIPRSPVFEIIQANFKPWYHGAYPGRILDLCAGSGCIGIACAYQFDEANVVLADLSEGALDVAAINIEQHQLQSKVVTKQSDLFGNLDGLFDVIVCNPPYVDCEDFAAMPSEFQHEPAMALESGSLGLDHPLQVLRQAADFLTDDGILVLEVGNSGMHLENLYPDVDFNWAEFKYGGFGVLVLSKVELEMYASQLALSPDYSDFDE